MPGWLSYGWNVSTALLASPWLAFGEMLLGHIIADQPKQIVVYKSVGEFA